MAVPTPKYLSDLSALTIAQGRRVNAQDFTFAIDGFEETYLLVKQAPWVEVGMAEPLESPGPLGLIIVSPGSLTTRFQGPIGLQESTTAPASMLLKSLLLNGGQFIGRCYEGTPQKYLRYKTYRNCIIVVDPVDRAWDTPQLLDITGTLHFNYYGDDTPGNSTDYR